MEKEKKVATKSNIPIGQGIAVDVDGKKIAVFNVDGEYCAIDDRCSHQGESLSGGVLNKNIVTCPLHS